MLQQQPGCAPEPAAPPVAAWTSSGGSMGASSGGAHASAAGSEGGVCSGGSTCGSGSGRGFCASDPLELGSPLPATAFAWARAGETAAAPPANVKRADDGSLPQRASLDETAAGQPASTLPLAAGPAAAMSPPDGRRQRRRWELPPLPPHAASLAIDPAGASAAHSSTRNRPRPGSAGGAAPAHDPRAAARARHATDGGALLSGSPGPVGGGGGGAGVDLADFYRSPSPSSCGGEELVRPLSPFQVIGRRLSRVPLTMHVPWAAPGTRLLCAHSRRAGGPPHDGFTCAPCRARRVRCASRRAAWPRPWAARLPAAPCRRRAPLASQARTTAMTKPSRRGTGRTAPALPPPSAAAGLARRASCPRSLPRTPACCLPRPRPPLQLRPPPRGRGRCPPRPRRPAATASSRCTPPRRRCGCRSSARAAPRRPRGSPSTSRTPPAPSRAPQRRPRQPAAPAPFPAQPARTRAAARRWTLS